MTRSPRHAIDSDPAIVASLEPGWRFWRDSVQRTRTKELAQEIDILKKKIDILENKLTGDYGLRRVMRAAISNLERENQQLIFSALELDRRVGELESKVRG